MRIIDEALLASFRAKVWCEFCGLPFRSGLDPHHIFSRGAGRLDVRWCILALCRRCHLTVHQGKISRERLLAIAAKREGKTTLWIERLVYRLRRMRPGVTIVRR